MQNSTGRQPTSCKQLDKGERRIAGAGCTAAVAESAPLNTHRLLVAILAVTATLSLRSWYRVRSSSRFAHLQGPNIGFIVAGHQPGVHSRSDATNIYHGLTPVPLSTIVHSPIPQKN